MFSIASYACEGELDGTEQDTDCSRLDPWASASDNGDLARLFANGCQPDNSRGEPCRQQYPDRAIEPHPAIHLSDTIRKSTLRLPDEPRGDRRLVRFMGNRLRVGRRTRLLSAQGFRAFAGVGHFLPGPNLCDGVRSILRCRLLPRLPVRRVWWVDRQARDRTRQSGD